jgi:hypothetical protein
LEQLQFGGAEGLAGFGGVADGAVVLDEQKAAVVVLDNLRHVPLQRALSSEGFDTVSQTEAGLDGFEQDCQLALGARFDDLLQGVLAQCSANARDQVHRKLVVAVGEEVVGQRCEAPEDGGTSPATGARLGLNDEALGFQRAEMLPGGDIGHGDPLGDLTGGRLAGAFQVRDDPSLRIARGRCSVHALSIRQRS